MPVCIFRKIRILKLMKTIELPSIPVSPDTAARFASLTEEQKRVVIKITPEQVLGED